MTKLSSSGEPCVPFEVTLTDEDGGRFECRQVLRIVRNGTIILEQSDGGEPEDQSFYRDWDWVPYAINKAYALGLEDGQKAADVRSDEGKGNADG